MITNHHISTQIAAERQRDLRAASGGWSLSDMFGRRARRAPANPSAAASAGPLGSEDPAPAGALTGARPLPERTVHRPPLSAGEGSTIRPRIRRRAREREGTSSRT
jgi:hypothetical protein